MSTVDQICQFMDSFAPRRLAEDWDNVGLLVGDRSRPANKVMTCLTVTPESVSEAIEAQANLVVTHHPIPFRPLKRITTDSVTGDMLLRLVENQIAVYSPHTAFDSTTNGINERLIRGLGVTDPIALEPIDNDPQGLGAGRYGELPSAKSLVNFIQDVKSMLGLGGLHIVGDPQIEIQKIAVACGAAGQFLGRARRLGCDCLVIGETNFHTCLEAKATGVALVLTGHFASERFAVEDLAEVLRGEFPNCEVWPSVKESDPLMWI